MKKLILISIFYAMNIIIHAQNFVSIQNGKFRTNGADFYPITINYCVNIVKDNSTNKYWVSPDHRYGNGSNTGSPSDPNKYECKDSISCRNEIKASFQLLKDKQFNSIRLCGFNVEENNSDGKMLRTTYPIDLSSLTPYEELISPYTQHFELLTEVLDIADEVGIKVVILTGIRNNDNRFSPNSNGFSPITIQSKYADFIEKLATYFSNRTAILAYDICNEPVIHTPLSGTKSEICSIVTGWIGKIKSKDANHLITIGFSGSGEVIGTYGWDPNLIPVNFASFHPYPSSPYNESIVENEIYWYKNNINKPWIIGETGGANLEGTPDFDEQIDLARKSLRRVKNCNGIGYSWWQYSDLADGDNDNADYGIVSNSGTTSTLFGNAQGSLKPFAAEFVDFVNNYNPDYNCSCLTNYYNDRDNNKYIVSGLIKNANTNTPIEGAIVYGWDDNWLCYSTRTNSNGVFNLFSNTKIRNDFGSPYASGAGYSIVQFSYSGNTSTVLLQNKTINIGASETQNTSGSITCKNFTIKGNGTTGGNVKLYGGGNVIFQSSTSVEKGAYLVVEPKNDYGEIKITPLNSCSTLKSAKGINESLSINATNEINQQLKIFPNPSERIVNIQLDTNEQKTIELYDIFGKRILSITTNEQNSILDISSYSSGVYMLRVTTNKGSESRKIIHR